MDPITSLLQTYHTKVFAEHGATAKGVDWNDESEVLVRYDKMLNVVALDCTRTPGRPTFLDVGCGWGGMAKRAEETAAEVSIVGIDVVQEMIAHASSAYPLHTFRVQDVFAITEQAGFDYVVCNAILTQKHDVSIPEMERFAKRLVLHMYSLARRGIAFNMMSTRVNYTAPNLYYQNPVELLGWLLADVSPRVILDHGYSSLASGKGRFYDFTVYVFKG